MSIPINISKLDAAKRELDHSIRLFFSYGDVIVIHLVSSASYSILIGLGKKAGVTSVREEMCKRVKKEKIKYVQKKLKKAYNFFKHAHHDHNKLLKFYPESSEFIIWDSINIYQNLTKKITGLMLSFRLWFNLKNNEIILKTEDMEYFKDASSKIDINNKNLFLEAAAKFENKGMLGALGYKQKQSPINK